MRDTNSETTDESFADLVSRVIDDATEVARAEVDLVKVQATARIAGYRNAIALFLLAALLAVLGAIGLVVGLILTIAQYCGAGWATSIVVGAIFLSAGLLGWLGARRWRQG